MAGMPKMQEQFSAACGTFSPQAGRREETAAASRDPDQR
jgi:hypothetical protein